MTDSAEKSLFAPSSRPHQRLHELVERMRGGSSAQVTQAQSEFYTELFRQLSRSSAARYLGKAAFEDLFQVTMIAVWDSLDSYRGDASLVTWVYSIFKNKVKDLARSYHTRMVDPLDDEEFLVSEEVGAPERMAKEQVLRFLNGCLDTLRSKAPRRAQVIELVRLEYSMNEIADIVDAPVGTVKRWASEGKDALALCIRRHGVINSQG
jgi:RNA polymerase sigma factor (sigma-70 family)